MFISVLPGEQVEVALAEEGAKENQVKEYYVEMVHQAKTKGNIYRGIINNVDTNLQAAFVNYGAEKNGFLQIDEVHPEYYNTPHDATKGKKYPLMQKVLKAGQEVLVQVVKEPTGSKGAFLTTYLSMPGRFLVLTPGREQIGVSRKVEDDEERGRLREMLEGLNPGPGLGVIVRTVSAGTSKTTLQRDLQELSCANIPLYTKPGRGRELVWCLDEEFVKFIPMTLSSRELMVSYFLERLAAVTRGTRLESDIQSLLAKAKQLVSPDVFRTSDQLENAQAMFGATFVGHIDYGPHSETIDTLVQAISQCRRCRFIYKIQKTRHSQ